jgi:nucleoside-diphosphate-sugar epimerase
MIRFASNLAAGKPIEVHTGRARGWLHISDAVKAIESAAHTKGYNVINIGHPEITSIADLAEMIRSELGASQNLIVYRDLPGRMTLVKKPMLNRQRDILGIVPQVSLSEGVKRVCKRIKDRLAAGEMIFGGE